MAFRQKAQNFAFLFLWKRAEFREKKSRNTGLGQLPVKYSGGYDAHCHKASTRRLHARLAYVMRVDDRASVALAAESFRARPRFKNF
jgi:hypothetical protein